MQSGGRGAAPSAGRRAARGSWPHLWTAAPPSPPSPRLGVLFSPLLPAMQIIKLLLLFYVKKVKCPLGPVRAAGPWAPGGRGQPGWATQLADLEPRDVARVAWGWQPRASLWGQSPDPRSSRWVSCRSWLPVCWAWGWGPGRHSGPQALRPWEVPLVFCPQSGCSVVRTRLISLALHSLVSTMGTVPQRKWPEMAFVKR